MALFRRGGKDPATEDTVEDEVDESTVVDDGPDLDDAPEVVGRPGRADRRSVGRLAGRRRPRRAWTSAPSSCRACRAWSCGWRSTRPRTSCPPRRSSWTAPRCRSRPSPRPAPTASGTRSAREIAESVTQQGGSADDLPGPFGRELLARLPVRTPEGRTGHRPARFIGADGPRWFVRGVHHRPRGGRPGGRDRARAAVRRDRRGARHRRAPAPRPADADASRDRARPTSSPAATRPETSARTPRRLRLPTSTR